MSERTIEQAMQNAARLRAELPMLIQPTNTDRDMVVLADEIESLRSRLAEAEVLIAKGLAVVHDFLPNIGRCVLQDYQRMNEFCCEAATRAAMKRLKTVSQWIGSKP